MGGFNSINAESVNKRYAPQWNRKNENQRLELKRHKLKNPRACNPTLLKFIRLWRGRGLGSGRTMHHLLHRAAGHVILRFRSHGLPFFTTEK